MHLRFFAAMTVGCALLYAPVAATAAGRGPSTPEERKQALEYIHDFLSNPQGPNAAQERQWTTHFIFEAPDIHIHLCSDIAGKLDSKKKKEVGDLLAALMLAQAEYAIQHLEGPADPDAEALAGMEGLLRAYERILKDNDKERQPALDDLIKMRDSGTLADLVKQQGEGCKK